MTMKTYSATKYQQRVLASLPRGERVRAFLKRLTPIWNRADFAPKFIPNVKGWHVEKKKWVMNKGVNEFEATQRFRAKMGL